MAFWIVHKRHEGLRDYGDRLAASRADGSFSLGRAQMIHWHGMYKTRWMKMVIRVMSNVAVKLLL